jgi:SAM-dependent methyltransferase
MNPVQLDYKEINKKLWNDKVAPHFESEFYDVKSFIDGKQCLNSIELDLLGNIERKSIIHPQCHFGQGTIALNRLGAKVTGIDLSDKAIEAAKSLAKTCGSDAQFVCCDLYEAQKFVKEKFDFVFSSYGTIGWLPDLDKWAAVVRNFLKPNGRFVFAEFHPVVWMLDSQFNLIEYSYFNKETIIENVPGTYADRNAQIQNPEITWNHNLAEVPEALLNQGWVLETFQEFDYSPVNCFPNTIQIEEGKFQIKGLEGKLPMVYGLRMKG